MDVAGARVLIPWVPGWLLATFLLPGLMPEIGVAWLAAGVVEVLCSFCGSGAMLVEPDSVTAGSLASFEAAPNVGSAWLGAESLLGTGASSEESLSLLSAWYALQQRR